MAKNNQTALILTLVIVASLISIAGGIGWLVYQSTFKSGSSTVIDSKPPLQATAPNSSQLDYSSLQGSLQQKNLLAADRATYELMLQAAGPKAQAKGFIPKEEMATLSCTDLKKIDDFWTKATNGQQGFSVQQDILKAQGDYRKMYAQVGWQSASGEWLIGWNYNPQTKRMQYQPGKEPNFKNPPSGHLPTVERGYNFDVSLNQALQRCGL